MLGCVLCAPGCFTMLRATVVKEVMEKYSSEAETANEKVMRDQGKIIYL